MRDGSIYAILYAVAWILLFLWFLKKYGIKSSSVFVTSFYVLFSIAAIFLYHNEFYASSFKTITLFPYVYLFVMVLLSLQPIVSFDKSNVVGLVEPPPSLIAVFTYVFIFLAILSLPNSIGNVVSGITLLLQDSNAGAELYADAHGGGISTKSIADVPRYLFSIFSYISIFVFFYYLVRPKLNKIVLFGLSIVMLYNLVRPISLGLRTDTVMTLFAIMVGYILMRRWIPLKRGMTLVLIGSIFCAVVVGFMLVLSASRFSKNIAGMNGTNLYYIAQSTLNFNNYGLDAGGIRYGDRTCRIFKEFLGFENVPSGIVERRVKYRHMRMNDGVFYTFVGDFTLDFGPVIAFFIFVLYSILFSFLSNVRGGVISFSRLLIVYLEMLIPVQGGMYLFTFSDGGNYSLVAFTLTAILFFKFDHTSSNQIIWASNEYLEYAFLRRFRVIGLK